MRYERIVESSEWRNEMKLLLEVNRSLVTRERTYHSRTNERELWSSYRRNV